ncbi:hypothetical protein Patl1_15350 [Pistacia atlantica]|uniref:Uncharacterized protein n=1 Tax=Pistacia atlantica TaxID=434234 RepID=A0ACC1BAB5_9ROSI|nr:hypothetical protein Patl1_15350 [Pistacia atlantica]
MLGGCSLLTTEFLWFTRATAKVREEAGEQESVPLLQKAIVDLAQAWIYFLVIFGFSFPPMVYLRLQSSSATLKCLQKDEKEHKRSMPCMELVSKGFEKESALEDKRAWLEHCLASLQGAGSDGSSFSDKD